MRRRGSRYVVKPGECEYDDDGADERQAEPDNHCRRVEPQLAYRRVSGVGDLHCSSQHPRITHKVALGSSKCIL